IDGIPPAIAVTHKNPSRSNRATVGTTTEVNEYLALLFARAGEVICYQCSQPVRRDSPESVAENLSHLAAGMRLMIGFDTKVPEEEPADRWIADLVGAGYVRAVVGERTESLEPPLAKKLAAGDRLTIILDRLSVGDQSAERLRDSIESAFA